MSHERILLEVVRNLTSGTAYNQTKGVWCVFDLTPSVEMGRFFILSEPDTAGR